MRILPRPPKRGDFNRHGEWAASIHSMPLPVWALLFRCVMRNFSCSTDKERMRKQALNLGRGYFGYRQPVIETSFLGLMAFRLLALTSWLWWVLGLGTMLDYRQWQLAILSIDFIQRLSTISTFGHLRLSMMTVNEYLALTTWHQA